MGCGECGDGTHMYLDYFKFSLMCVCENNRAAAPTIIVSRAILQLFARSTLDFFVAIVIPCLLSREVASQAG